MNGQGARQLFELPLLCQELSIQEGDRYLLVVAERVDPDEDDFGINAYLFDLQTVMRANRLPEQNITKDRFGEILDAAISRHGDVVFTNLRYREKHFVNGLYFIPNHELKMPIPKAELLIPGSVENVDWSPNGEEVVFSTKDGIFRLNVFTKQVTHLIQDGSRPVFSPDGKKIAFFTRTRPAKLSIISRKIPHDMKQFKIEDDGRPRYLTWSFDGQYIAYTLSHLFEGVPFSNFAVLVSGGRHIPILQAFNGGVGVFEWRRKVYAVEPEKKLTTLWGKLKQQDRK